MVTRSTDSKAAPTGVAISSNEIVAVDARLRGSSDRTWRAALEAPLADGGWPSLGAALADLARALGVTEGRMSVSLMPPLVEVRQLELPPLGEVELQRVLSRDAARYFVNGRVPQLIGASIASKKGRRGPATVVAAAAPARLVASIRAAAASAGWTIHEIGPAETAWTAASLSLWPAFAKQNANVLMTHDDRTDLLQIEGGRLAGVRRFRAGGADAAMIGDTLGPSARVGIAGTSLERKELSAALSSHRVSLASASGNDASSIDSPAALAAAFAGSNVGPLLRTDDAVATEAADVRRATWTMVGIAAALFVVAAGVELYGVHRQLEKVQSQRAALRPQLSATLVARTTVTATYGQLAALDSIERAAPQWSSIIGTLSDAVPDDAYLTAIRARDDSLIVDGLSARAKPVFDALEGTKGLIDVRASSPVRRELQDDGRALEHFTIAARVSRQSPSLVAPVSARSGGTR